MRTFGESGMRMMMESIVMPADIWTQEFNSSMIYKKETFLEIWSITIEVGNQRKGKLCDLQYFPSENHYKAWVFSLIF